MDFVGIVVEAALAVVVLGVKSECTDRRDAFALILRDERERSVVELHAAGLGDPRLALDHDEQGKGGEVVDGLERAGNLVTQFDAASVEQVEHLGNRSGDDSVVSSHDRLALRIDELHAVRVDGDVVSLDAQAQVEVLPHPLGQRGHAGGTPVARVAVRFAEPATPFRDDSGFDRLSGELDKAVTTGREELSSVVEYRIADSPSREPSSDAATFVDHGDLMSSVDKIASCGQAGETGTKNDCVRHPESMTTIAEGGASHPRRFAGMARVLVTEEIAEDGLQRLRDAGHEVDVQMGLEPAALNEAIKGADALIIRSATTVTADMLAAADVLKVVGRAGIGLDNVDVDAATNADVLVCNAPFSNAVSAAEHTMALMLSMARNVAPAHAALVDGRWERSKWKGVELDQKTLGIIGLGRIGRLVGARAAAFGMTLVAYDPFISAEAAAEVGAELLDLDALMATSDFVTLHLARTPETMNLLNAELFAKSKPGQRVINVARGGIIDEAALAQAIIDGPVGGAAIDVFAEEPTTDSPLFSLPQVTVTPHLGASTDEAQLKAGTQIAEQVEIALGGQVPPFAVNAK